MKKLFISCPMRGRTEEEIKKSMKKMHKIAEVLFEEELEAIPNYIIEKNPENCNERIWCLGDSIKLMARADYFIGVYNECDFKGCYIENEVARLYGIPRKFLNIEDVMECQPAWAGSISNGTIDLTELNCKC